ncbi:protein ABHD13-like [Tubulanus polymorphus]|uniref:protein ABHD13-like n=1 Tax=Tubulanus polymorphus TaxID=672921 RepID=UPI003DA4300C
MARGRYRIMQVIDKKPSKCRVLVSILYVAGKLVWQAAVQLWAFCMAMLLSLFLFYWLYGSVAAFLLLCFAVVGFLYNAQDTLLFYPEQPPTARLYVESPQTLGLPYENINIQTRDNVRINMQFIPRPNGQRQHAVTMLLLHGNAGNIGHRLPNAYYLYNMLGFNILLVEYRGYGKSSGSPSEQGIYLDAQAALEYLMQRTDINTKRIVVFGRSLGGAVAINLASNGAMCQNIWAVIIENTFTSLPEIGRNIFNFKVLNFLPDWCFKNQFPSKCCIRQCNVPTLFLSGLSDTLIPPSMMAQLYEACGSAHKRIARFESGTHNETWQVQGYFEAISKFLQELDRVSQYLPERNKTSHETTVEIPFDDGGRNQTIKSL